MSRSAVLVFVTGAVCVAAGVAVFLFVMRRPCTPASCLSIPDMALWQETERYESTTAVWRGMLTRGRDRLRISLASNINASDAAYIRTIETVRLATMYEPARSPYPGEVSRTIRCDSSMMPKTESFVHDGDPLTFVSAYANDRFVFGACTESQTAYAGFVVMRHCVKQRMWLHAEYFTPDTGASPDAYRDFLSSITCADRRMPVW